MRGSMNRHTARTTRNGTVVTKLFRGTTPGKLRLISVISVPERPRKRAVRCRRRSRSFAMSSISLKWSQIATTNGGATPVETGTNFRIRLRSKQRGAPQYLRRHSNNSRQATQVGKRNGVSPE